VHLEPLSVFHWNYDEDVRVAAPGYAIVSGREARRGVGYGEGRGTATGRLEGSLVELRGRTIFEGDEPGWQSLVGWLESDHESYRWLNDVVSIAEV
jgi:hypothetical protein